MENTKKSKTIVINHKRYDIKEYSGFSFPCIMCTLYKKCAFNSCLECANRLGGIGKYLDIYHKPKTYIK